jgi:hypothetical protein
MKKNPGSTLGKTRGHAHLAKVSKQEEPVLLHGFMVIPVLGKCISPQRSALRAPRDAAGMQISSSSAP